LQSSSLTQHNTKPQKTVKNAPKPTKKKEKTSPERLFFSFISSVFPPAPLAFRSRAQRRTKNNDETPEEKTGFVTKIQSAAASGFVTFSKWVLRKCEEQDTD